MSCWNPPAGSSDDGSGKSSLWPTLMPFISSLLFNLIPSGVKLDAEKSITHEPFVSLQST